MRFCNYSICVLSNFHIGAHSDSVADTLPSKMLGNDFREMDLSTERKREREREREREWQKSCDEKKIIFRADIN